MPSNKEIAEWMETAAVELSVIAKCIPEGAPMRAMVERNAVIMLEQSNLIEQMRCETCRWWSDSLWQATPETRICLYPARRRNAESWGFIEDSGPQFCCCHWEGKE